MAASSRLFLRMASRKYRVQAWRSKNEQSMAEAVAKHFKESRKELDSVRGIT